jgi:hypothetical protein
MILIPNIGCSQKLINLQCISAHAYFLKNCISLKLTKAGRFHLYWSKFKCKLEESHAFVAVVLFASSPPPPPYIPLLVFLLPVCVRYGLPTLHSDRKMEVEAK